MNGNHNRHHLLLATLLGFGIASSPVQAEDTEVFFSQSAKNIVPNVLFVLDSSKSMDKVDGSNGSRLDILKNSMAKVLLPKEKYKALNVGIMDFGGYRSGGIDFPITDINSDANLVDSNIPAGTEVGKVLDYITKSYTASGQTPMGDALYFASNYYSGSRVFNSGNGRGWRNLPIPTWDSVANSYTGGDKEADNPATYTGQIKYTDVKETRKRDCSPSSRRPIRACGSSYDTTSCVSRLQNINARPKQYMIRTYSCDSTGLECNWNYPGYRNIDAGYPGDASCSSQPSNPQDGDTWVQCRAAQSAGSYTYQRCKEDYTHTDRTWAPASTYKTPITQQCQKNFVVLLSDGEPTRADTRHYIASRASAVIGSNKVNDCDDVGLAGSKIRNNGRCLPELVQYMAEYDQSTNLPGDQTISTYTIGFMLGNNAEAETFLTRLATTSKAYGQKMGEYFSASNAKDLVDIFKKIINDVTDTGVSFSAPAVSIDQNNRLATSEYVYRTEFTPSSKPRWSGDVFKSKADPNSASGFTDETTTLASTLVANARKIVTVTNKNFNLNAPENVFSANNGDLKNLLGSLHSSGVDPAKLIQWTLGTDVQDENGDNNYTDERKHMGDALHTTPAMVTYPKVSGTKRQILFVPTNEGLLHAFEVTNGTPVELFAFMPPALLKNLDTLYRNLAGKKVYGLDSNLAVWQDGNKAILYFGMRRGGRNYYALDVSDPDAPQLLWRIEGGKIAASGDDFTELGQTWSKPQLTNVMVGGTETLALVFGGGYDTQQDDTNLTTRTDDTVGRAVYIVNAETGDLIWSAGPGNAFNQNLPLKNSIPSDIRIIDLDGNRRADRLYVGDTGGRVWRIDLDQTDISSSKTKGYLLADFNDGTAAGNRRFYYAPGVAFDRKRRLLITIGSGYRAHPDSTGTIDRFYVFEDKDADIGVPTSTPTALNDTKLGDISGDVDSKKAFAGNLAGWRIDMHPNEKVLAESVIFNNKVVFTTYQPEFSGSSSTCKDDRMPRAYALALENGRPVKALAGGSNTQGPFTLDDRFMKLSTVKYIPGSPYVTINEKQTSGGQNNQPLGQPADVYEAGLYADGDLLLKDGFMSQRISWQNQ